MTEQGEPCDRTNAWGDPESIDYEISESAAVLAAIRGAWEEARTLILRDDCDADATDSEGNTALIVAAQQGEWVNENNICLFSMFQDGRYLNGRVRVWYAWGFLAPNSLFKPLFSTCSIRVDTHLILQIRQILD